MAFTTMDPDVLIKEEPKEESEIDYNTTEENDINPWFIENAETFLKYCCSNCNFSSKDLRDFSKHVSSNHFTSNMFFQTNTDTEVKETLGKSLKKSKKGKCVVPNCTVEKSFGFFKFPKQQEKLDSWLELCGLKMVQKEDRICADHFDNSDFCLKSSANPSLNLNTSNRKTNAVSPTKGTVVAKVFSTKVIANTRCNCKF